MRIYVGGFPAEVKEADLQQLFGKFKSVGLEQIEVIPHKLNPGLSRGFAYVTFRSDAAAAVQKVITAYNGSKWKGGRLKLEPAGPNYLERLALEKASAAQKSTEQPQASANKGEDPRTDSAHLEALKTVKIGIGNKGSKTYLILPLEPVEVKGYEGLSSTLAPKKGKKRQNTQLSGTAKKLRTFCSIDSKPLRRLQWDVDPEEQTEGENDQAEQQASSESETEETEPQNDNGVDLAEVEFNWDDGAGEEGAGADEESISAESADEQDESAVNDGKEESEKEALEDSDAGSSSADESLDAKKHLSLKETEILHRDGRPDSREKEPISPKDEERIDAGDEEAFQKGFEEERNRSLNVLASLFPEEASKTEPPLTHTEEAEINIRRNLFKRPLHGAGLASLNAQFRRYDPTADDASTYELSSHMEENISQVQGEEKGEEKEIESTEPKDIAFQQNDSAWNTESSELKTIFGRFRMTDGEKKSVEEKKQEAKQIESFSLASLFTFAEDPKEELLGSSEVQSSVQKLVDAETMFEFPGEENRYTEKSPGSDDTSKGDNDGVLPEIEDNVVYDLEALLDSFRRRESMEAIEQHWLEKRRGLTQDYKRKHKQAIRARRGMRPTRHIVVQGSTA